MNLTGVAVMVRKRGTLHDITLTGLYGHDVKGNVYDKHMNNGGIYCTALTPSDKKAFEAEKLQEEVKEMLAEDKDGGM